MYRLLVIAVLFLVLPPAVQAEGTVVETTFFSQSMGQEKELHVYLPEGYDSQGWGRYPVIYYLHGAGALLGHDDFSELVEALDQMIAAGIIKPVIAVMPDGFASPYPAAFYTGSILYGDLEGYMTGDLVAWMDQNYRTIPSHRKRVVMGHSMGGYGAVLYYGKHPDLYCGAAAVCGSGMDLPTMVGINLYGILAELGGVPPYYYSPTAGFANAVLFSMAGAFTPDLTNPPYFVELPLDEYANIIPEVWAVWLEHNLPEYLGWMSSDCGSTCPTIYFDAGTEDQFYTVPASNAFAANLDAMGIPYQYEIFEGGHFDKLDERFPIALEFLCGLMNHTWGWSMDQGSEPGNSAVIASHAASMDDGTVTFSLNVQARVALEVYDLSGRVVVSSAAGMLEQGTHILDCCTRDLSAGVYFYSITACGETVTGKIINTL